LKRARLASTLLVLSVLAASLFASGTHARRQDGRPRRVVGTTAQPSPSRTPQQTGSRTAQTSAPRGRQTPTPTPTPSTAPSNTQQQQTTGGAPKLRTSPTAEPDATQHEPTDEEIEEGGVVRVESNLVNLHVRVIDRNNRPINDVTDSDFHVFENGVPQQVQFVTREEVPITYGLVVDNSGSLRSQISQVVEAAKTIVASNKPGDETFVVRFIASDEIKILQDFTADKNALGDALDDMFIEGGQTAVIDAVYLAAEHASERRKNDPVEDKRRRALVLVTDGEDRNSFYKTEQLFESLKEEDVQIYVIGFVNELEKDRGFISKSKRQKAVDLLDRMAKETGGRTFYPTSLSELPQIADEITKDLRTQYVISYKPAASARPGEYRPVRVAVSDGRGGEHRIAVTRSGYTAKGDTNTTTPTKQQPTQSTKSPAPARRP
jgi:Ca-activated chloride channel family protein